MITAMMWSCCCFLDSCFLDGGHLVLPISLVSFSVLSLSLSVMSSISWLSWSYKYIGVIVGCLINQNHNSQTQTTQIATTMLPFGNNHLFSFICVIVLLFIITVSPSESKHHVGTHSCPVTRRCSTHHSHKICGSDGHLYPSHCHLRKVACERGLPTLRAVHPDQCVSEEDDDPDQDEGLGRILGKETNNEDLRQQQQRSPTNQEASPSSFNFVDSDQSSCGPKEYDSMKEAILQKVNNDISLLFSQLDDNGDGSLSINELWKKSGVFKVSSSSMNCFSTRFLTKMRGKLSRIKMR